MRAHRLGRRVAGRSTESTAAPAEGAPGESDRPSRSRRCGGLKLGSRSAGSAGRSAGRSAGSRHWSVAAARVATVLRRVTAGATGAGARDAAGCGLAVVTRRRRRTGRTAAASYFGLGTGAVMTPESSSSAAIAAIACRIANASTTYSAQPIADACRLQHHLGDDQQRASQHCGNRVGTLGFGSRPTPASRPAAPDAARIEYPVLPLDSEPGTRVSPTETIGRPEVEQVDERTRAPRRRWSGRTAACSDLLRPRAAWACGDARPCRTATGRQTCWVGCWPAGIRNYLVSRS